MHLSAKVLLLSSFALAACSTERAPDRTPEQQNASPAPAASMPTQKSGKTVSLKVPDGRTVTFDCGSLSPEGALTGAFISPLDVTTEEQIEEMRRNGTFQAWEQSRKDMTSTRSGFNMLLHIAGHMPPYQYCPDQADQIRTGTFQNTGAACPAADAYQLCRPQSQ